MTDKYHNLQGEDKNQYLVTCDKHGKITGIVTREKCHAGDGIPHLAFMAFVFDREGKIIMTRRSDSKSLWPGAWDASTISHILPKETAGEAANRRGKEELGIDVAFKVIGSFYYFAGQEEISENEYCYVLVGKTDQEPHANPVEICELKRMIPKEVSDIFDLEPQSFTPWFGIAWDQYHSLLEK